MNALSRINDILHGRIQADDKLPAILAEIPGGLADEAKRDEAMRKMAEALRHARHNMPHPDQMVDEAISAYEELQK